MAKKVSIESRPTDRLAQDGIRPVNKFRLAKDKDILFILSLLRDFYEQHKATYLSIPYDESSACATIIEVIQDGICLVGSKSCAGVVINSFPFNHQAKVAHVVFWKIEGHSELCVFEHLMALAKQVGATHFTASAQFPDCRIGRYYQSLGFTECEKSFISKL